MRKRRTHDPADRTCRRSLSYRPEPPRLTALERAQWDMFHEKFGFMLIFWNMAGVPFTYCYPVIYMARSDPSTYRYPVWVNVAMYVTLLGAYYVYVAEG